MSVNINLVDSKNSDAVKREKIKKIRAISFGVLFATAFLAVVIFAADYRFSASYVRKQEADLLKELEPYNDVSAKIFIINSKLSDLDKLLNKRTKYSDKVNKIAEGNKGDIVFDNFTINSEGVDVIITSDSITAVDDYLNYLIGLANDKEFSSVTLKKLNANETGFRVELTLI